MIDVVLTESEINKLILQTHPHYFVPEAYFLQRMSISKSKMKPWERGCSWCLYAKLMWSEKNNCDSISAMISFPLLLDFFTSHYGKNRHLLCCFFMFRLFMQKNILSNTTSIVILNVNQLEELNINTHLKPLVPCRS